MPRAQCRLPEMEEPRSVWSVAPPAGQCGCTAHRGRGQGPQARGGSQLEGSQRGRWGGFQPVQEQGLVSSRGWHSTVLGASSLWGLG